MGSASFPLTSFPPYQYDSHNPPYLSRLHQTVFVVQSPIPPGQLSPELLPHKFPIQLLQHGLECLKKRANSLPPPPSSPHPNSPIPVHPLINDDDHQKQQLQKSLDLHAANITNEQITFDQLSQLPDNTPTMMSLEEFQAFFRILNSAHLSYQSSEPRTPSGDQKSIVVNPCPLLSSSNKRSRSDSSMTPKTDQLTRRTTATFAQKIEILNWYHAHGRSQTGTAKHFDAIYPELRIKQPLVSAWVKDESHIRTLAPPGSTTAKRVRGTTHPEVTSMLEEWVQQAILANHHVTGEVICEKWKQFAKLCGIPTAEWLTLSHGWLDAFRQRNGLRHLKKQTDSTSRLSNPEHDRARVAAIAAEYAAQDIYNMDETGLFYA